ncbi:MAG: hypothetical protein IFK94_05575 [Acidobacteria bacterium]|uniref:VWFA domain-containing protein n=1 Tax=Candidatus Polarisedimenticola svalbardensis TaxID=2886004 RepID=A0A8J7C2F0_9BACT|nr:hypothetical protein [Candidatus Polarisedimenticola svalbardensis]
MNASIDEARIHLWGIVDDLSRLEPTPRLRVALLSYGNSRNPRESGWIRINRPLTDDLDAVSRSLFELRTGGSEEYVERVVRVALDQLEWSEEDQAVRMIFVMGNEEADQDQAIDPEDLALDAGRREIAVHPIYVGGGGGRNYQTWRSLSETLGVQVATLRPGKRPEGPASPFDRELASSGQELSATYVPYGENGAEAAENQILQDQNVESLGVSVAASRAITKAGPLYQGDWDLVDAVDSGRVFLEDVPEEDLPAIMQAMTPAERDDYLFRLADRRRELKDRIRSLGEQRERHIESSRAAGVKATGDDLRRLVRRTVRERAEAQGFEF